MQTELTVKETATLTGLSAYTLRYYGRIGLPGPVGRPERRVLLETHGREVRG